MLDISSLNNLDKVSKPPILHPVEDQIILATDEPPRVSGVP